MCRFMDPELLEFLALFCHLLTMKTLSQNNSGGSVSLPVEKRFLIPFENEPRILAAYMLGSAVRGLLRPDSDLDFGILLHPGEMMSALDINDIASDLTLSFGRPVDIGLVSAHNLIYARQCVLTGKQIFCRDVFRAGLAVVALLGLAMQLDIERREILHAYST